MTYSKQEIFDTVKNILLHLDIFKHISEEDIVPSASLKYDFGFDEYDLQELVLQIEYRKSVNIKNNKALNKLMTLDEFCIALCKYLNTPKMIAYHIHKTNLFYRIKQRFLTK